MSRFLCLTLTLLAVLLTSSPSLVAASAKPDRANSNQAIMSVLDDLVLAMATRPGVTDSDDIEAIKPAVRSASRAFRKTLAKYGFKRTKRLTRLLAPSLDSFNRAYLSAAHEENGVDEKGSAVIRLFKDLFVVADQTKLSLETLEIAILSAASTLERELDQEPLHSKLSLESRELIDLLQITAGNHVSLRVSIEMIRNAIIVFAPQQEVLEEFDRQALFVENQNFTNLSSLEVELNDPLVLSSYVQLIYKQYNSMALNDLTFIKLGMLLFGGVPFIDPAERLNVIATRMDSVGGVMSGMTSDLLKNSLVLGPRISLSYPPDSSTAYPYVLWNRLTVTDWIKPQKRIVYRSDPDLYNTALQLGGRLPMRGDFSLFSNPYSSIFKLFYDLSLIDHIATRSLQLADDGSDEFIAGPDETMQARMQSMQALVSRTQALMSRLKGVQKRHKAAMVRFLTRLRRY